MDILKPGVFPFNMFDCFSFKNLWKEFFSGRVSPNNPVHRDWTDNSNIWGSLSVVCCARSFSIMVISDYVLAIVQSNCLSNYSEPRMKVPSSNGICFYFWHVWDHHKPSLMPEVSWKTNKTAIQSAITWEGSSTCHSQSPWRRSPLGLSLLWGGFTTTAPTLNGPEYWFLSPLPLTGCQNQFPNLPDLANISGKKSELESFRTHLSLWVSISPAFSSCQANFLVKVLPCHANSWKALKIIQNHLLSCFQWKS